jgi:hypothetical protein
VNAADEGRTLEDDVEVNRQMMRIAILGALLVSFIEAEAGRPFRGVVELTSFGYAVQVYVNGKHLPLFKGGTSEMTQLFSIDHPQKAETAPQLHSVYCLKPGQNTIRVEYRQVDAGLAVLPMSLSMNSPGYSSSVFEFKLKKADSGTFETEFEIYDTMPVTHTTQRVVRSPK